MLETVVSVVSALVAIVSLVLAIRQWSKVNERLAMLPDSTLASEVLPAWFTTRMMDDHWYFGLTTTSGRMVAISHVNSVSMDSKWMDVELLTIDNLPKCCPQDTIAAVSGDRTTATVRIDSIVSAQELAHT